MIRAIVRRRNGQAVTELAVVLPVLLFLILALLGVGFYLYAQIVSSPAANQSGRLAAVLYGDPDVSPSEANRRVRSTAYAVLSHSPFLEDVEVTITPHGDEIRVDVRGQFHVPVPWARDIFGASTVPVHDKATYLIEWKD